MTTPFQAKLWATQLTLKGPAGSVGQLSRSISNSRVDLNPHQVDAALFAVRSPLSKGVLLADEVGLGKTIEAGLVIAQRWAERRRRILVIVPATLRKQWAQEIDEKFGMPATVLEASSFNRLSKAGPANPFEVDDHVVICSYHVAANKSEQVARVPWDLVVIDESHRLRNVYKTGNKVARTLRDALRSPTKLLLTATPLQNTLMELFGVVSFIDEHVFGDEPSFRDQFLRSDKRICSTSTCADASHRSATELCAGRCSNTSASPSESRSPGTSFPRTKSSGSTRTSRTTCSATNCSPCPRRSGAAMMACEGDAGGRCAGVTRCETEAERTAAVGGNAISGVPPQIRLRLGSHRNGKPRTHRCLNVHFDWLCNLHRDGQAVRHALRQDRGILGAVHLDL